MQTFDEGGELAEQVTDDFGDRRVVAGGDAAGLPVELRRDANGDGFGTLHRVPGRVLLYLDCACFEEITCKCKCRGWRGLGKRGVDGGKRDAAGLAEIAELAGGQMIDDIKRRWRSRHGQKQKQIAQGLKPRPFLERFTARLKPSRARYLINIY